MSLLLLAVNYLTIHAQYFALININLNLQFYTKASFSLLLILLVGSDGHWTLDRSALITPYRAVVSGQAPESGAVQSPDTN